MNLQEALVKDGPKEYGRCVSAAIDLNDPTYYSRAIWADYVGPVGPVDLTVGTIEFRIRGSKTRHEKFSFTESERLSEDQVEQMQLRSRNDWIAHRDIA